MNEKIRDEWTDDLFDAILSIQDREECYRFFSDLCTVSEIKSLASRLRVAYLLNRGHTYTEIFEQTGVSTATISRVNRCLEYGADGYQAVLNRLTMKNDGKGTSE